MILIRKAKHLYETCGKFQNLVQILLNSLHRPSVEMTSPSGATKWKAASLHGFPTPSSGALWSIQAPLPRALPSTSRSQNELSSPTSQCEPRFTQCKQSSERGRYNWTVYSLQECEWDNVCGLSEGEGGGQEPVRSGQSEKQGSRHHQVQEQNSLSVSSPLCSLSVKLFCFFLLHRTNSQDMETFKTEVHVPSGSNIEFELHYQEMMHRKLNLYEHTLHLQPGRLVPQLQVRRSQIMWTCTSPGDPF